MAGAPAHAGSRTGLRDRDDTIRAVEALHRAAPASRALMTTSDGGGGCLVRRERAAASAAALSMTALAAAAGLALILTWRRLFVGVDLRADSCRHPRPLAVGVRRPSVPQEQNLQQVHGLLTYPFIIGVRRASRLRRNRACAVHAAPLSAAHARSRRRRIPLPAAISARATRAADGRRDRDLRLLGRLRNSPATPWRWRSSLSAPR